MAWFMFCMRIALCIAVMWLPHLSKAETTTRRPGAMAAELPEELLNLFPRPSESEGNCTAVSYELYIYKFIVL